MCGGGGGGGCVSVSKGDVCVSKCRGTCVWGEGIWVSVSKGVCLGGCV